MEEQSVPCVSRLRVRAARCSARAKGIAREPESIAQEYEVDADRIEHHAPSTQRPSNLGAS